MSERTDADFLADIQEAINRIKNYTTGITYTDFLADTKTQDAVIRNLEPKLSDFQVCRRYKEDADEL